MRSASRSRWTHVGSRLLPFIAIMATVVISAALGSSIIVWNWPDIGVPLWGDRLAIVRDIGVFAGAAFALLFAGWRGWAADRQAIAARDRADTAQRVLLNDRYQQSAEMLGSNVIAVRLGGIYALVHLAAEYSSDYHIQVMRLLCTFARERKNGLIGHEEESIADLSTTVPHPPDEVQAIVWAIGDRSDDQRDLERNTAERFEVDLDGLYFAGGNAEGTDLSGINLQRAQLSMANLAQVDLSGTQLQYSILIGAFLAEANLFQTRLWHADMRAAALPGANLWAAELLSTNLVAANMRGAELWSTDLSAADLRNADLSYTELVMTDLSDTNLAGVDFSGAKMNGAILLNANLSGAHFSRFGSRPVTGLTQRQLDQAVADHDDPPHLVSVTDAVTGRTLEWKSGPSSS